MTLDAKLVVAVIGFLFNMIWVEAVISYIDQTKTSPLVQLTLIQPGCEFVKRIGVDTGMSNGICTITVRYKKNVDDDGGTIEMNGIPHSSINSNQVIGRHQLNDGSDEPWSDEHRRAFEWLLGPVLFMISILVVLSLIKDIPEETKQRLEKTKPCESDTNAEKPNEDAQIVLPASGISNNSTQEKK
jgi:hypothetical protein